MTVLKPKEVYYLNIRLELLGKVVGEIKHICQSSVQNTANATSIWRLSACDAVDKQAEISENCSISVQGK